jgi:hypothetical protein
MSLSSLKAWPVSVGVLWRALKSRWFWRGGLARPVLALYLVLRARQRHLCPRTQCEHRAFFHMSGILNGLA